MKLISIDSLLSKLEGRSADGMLSIAAVRQMIRDEKQVDIVNCKECRYYKEDTIVCSRYGLEDDDFCSWGDQNGE